MIDIIYNHPEVTKIINNESLTEKERVFILENMNKQDHSKYISNHTIYNDLEFLVNKTINYKSKHPSGHHVTLISIDQKDFMVCTKLNLMIVIEYITFKLISMYI